MSAMVTPGEALLALLTRERAFLLTGELDALFPLGAEKLRLTEALSRVPPPPALIRALSQASQHNGRLIAAALAGVKATRARLSQQVGGGSTYDQTGRKSDLSARINPISRA